VFNFIEIMAEGPAGKDGGRRKTEISMAGRDCPLKISLLSSFIAHLSLLMLASNVIQQTHPRRQDLLTVSLFEVQPAKITSSPRIEARRQIRNPPTAPPTLAHAKEEPARPIEAKSSATAKPEIAPSVAPAARVEGGGSEAGAGNLFGKGDVGVVPGPGTAGGGGGTAASGLGRGSGAPGLPAQTTPLRTNREAKPIQTVKATYPPMALRMGMESDVTLKIEVDPDGRVTHAEITRSGGAGFDEEALKAVKQSRFEPAQKDGQNVPAEFIYIYRFRLQR
jgi:TonB family protein